MNACRNSHATILVDVFRSLFQDLKLRFPAKSKELSRDFLRIERQGLSEEMNFLGKGLAELGKHADSAILGNTMDTPSYWKPCSKEGSYPLFLSCIWKEIFDNVGNLRTEVDPEYVKAYRQVCFLAAKYQHPAGYTESQNQTVIDSFVKTERDIDRLPSDNSVLFHASEVGEMVWHRFDCRNISPKHGPGGVANGEKLEEKWAKNILFHSVHQVYPYYDYFYLRSSDPSGSTCNHLAQRANEYRSMERADYPVAKVVLVPKDYRGPRLISMEPKELQYLQQGLSRKMVAHLERHPITRGHVNFTSQDVNRKLALESSRTREWATLDLKEASDRVTMDHVGAIFGPVMSKHLFALRSHYTILPDGTKLHMKKFAPMGSALCFPAESFVFFALVFGLFRANGVDEDSARRMVYVYGDDLIVPDAWAIRVIDMLQEHGLLVNVSKSCFGSGPFRESCGCDAFNGVDVTPIRLKTTLPGPGSPLGTWAQSLCDSASVFRAGGYICVSEHLRRLVETHTKSVVPRVPFKSGMLSVFDESVSFIEAIDQIYDLGVERPKLRRIYAPVEFKKSTKLEDYHRLMRDLLSPTDEPDRDSTRQHRWRYVNEAFLRFYLPLP